MNTQITLNLNQNILEQATNYASLQKVSISELIENYLNSLPNVSPNQIIISPLVESLTGIISNENEQNKSDYQNYLTEKYK